MLIPLNFSMGVLKFLRFSIIWSFCSQLLKDTRSGRILSSSQRPRCYIAVLYRERPSDVVFHVWNLILILLTANCSLTLLIPVTCLHHLLPPTARCSYNLRKRQHGYQLSHVEYNLDKNSFINRCLFNHR